MIDIERAWRLSPRSRGGRQTWAPQDPILIVEVRLSTSDRNNDAPSSAAQGFIARPEGPDEVEVRQEAAGRLSLALGVVALGAAAGWIALGDPSPLLLLQLFGLGLFSVAWGINHQRQRTRQEDEHGRRRANRR